MSFHLSMGTLAALALPCRYVFLALICYAAIHANASTLLLEGMIADLDIAKVDMQRYVRWWQSLPEPRSLLRDALYVGLLLIRDAAVSKSEWKTRDGTDACDDAECYIAQVTLRCLIVFTLDDDMLRNKVFATNLSQVEYRYSYIVRDCLVRADRLLFIDKWASWSQISESGWPLFGLLFVLGSRLYGLPSKEIARDDALPNMAEFNQDLYEQQFLKDVRQLLFGYLNEDGEIRLAQTAVALGTRAVSIGGLCRLAVGASLVHVAVVASDVNPDPATNRANTYFLAAEQYLRACRNSFHLLELLDPNQAPIFALADRLSLSKYLDFDPGLVGVAPTASGRSVRLFLPRSLSSRSYGWISDQIRADGAPHINAYFLQAVAHRAAALAKYERSRPLLHLVDVGAHLGDACIWAATRYLDQVRCAAFEPMPELKPLISLSLKYNNLSGVVALASDRLGLDIKQGERRLDDVLGYLGFGPIDVLKIHTDGRELSILRSGIRAVRRSRVVIVAVSGGLDVSGVRRDGNAIRRWFSAFAPYHAITAEGHFLVARRSLISMRLRGRCGWKRVGNNQIRCTRHSISWKPFFVLPQL